MSSETKNLLERAKRQLRKVETVDESKRHGYLGRVVGQSTADTHHAHSTDQAVMSTEGKKSYSGDRYDNKPVEGRVLSLKDTPLDKGATTESTENKPLEKTTPALGTKEGSSSHGLTEVTSGLGLKEGTVGTKARPGGKEISEGLVSKETPFSGQASKGSSSQRIPTPPPLDKERLSSGRIAREERMPDEDLDPETLGEEEDDFDLCYVEDIDVPEQIKSIENDIEKLMHKLRLSEDRIRKHQIRKEQNVSIQRDAGIKAAELKNMGSEKDDLKRKAIDRQVELENQRAEAHKAAVNYEIERARLHASELATLEIQKIASQRIEAHERGIQFGRAIKRRLEIQMKILKAQKELLMFEGEMKDVLNDRPPLHHPAVNILHEVPTEKLEEHRVYNEIENEKGIASGVFEEEYTVLGDSDIPLRDSTFRINTVDQKNQ